MNRKAAAVRQDPRISVAKLGEYLEAPAPRRERILRDQKYPPTYIVNTYERARRSIQAALCGKGDPATKLEKLSKRIKALPAVTSHEVTSLRLSSIAIRKFARMIDRLELDAFDKLVPGKICYELTIEGVRVTIAPAVLLLHRSSEGIESWGGLFVILKKTAALSERAAKAIAETLRLALVDQGYVNVGPKMCIVADVFSKSVFRASGRSQRVIDEIESACREIAVRWPTLPPRRSAA